MVAVVASLDGRRFRSAEPGAIAELFADPRAVDFSDGRWQPLDGPLTDTAAWLEEQKEGLDRWT